MGCVCAIVFTCFGSAYGTAKAGVGVCATGVLRPDLIVRSTSWPNLEIDCRWIFTIKIRNLYFLRT